MITGLIIKIDEILWNDMIFMVCTGIFKTKEVKIDEFTFRYLTDPTVLATSRENTSFTEFKTETTGTQRIILYQN